MPLTDAARGGGIGYGNTSVQNYTNLGKNANKESFFSVFLSC